MTRKETAKLFAVLAWLALMCLTCAISQAIVWTEEPMFVWLGCVAIFVAIVIQVALAVKVIFVE